MHSRRVSIVGDRRRDHRYIGPGGPEIMDFNMRLTVIGSSGLFASATSPTSSYLVEAEDTHGRTWRVLLDLGSGVLGPLQRLVALPDIDAILLSNLDLEHCADLWSLYVALKYYAPSGTPR